MLLPNFKLFLSMCVLCAYYDNIHIQKNKATITDRRTRLSLLDCWVWQYSTRYWVSKIRIGMTGNPNHFISDISRLQCAYYHWWKLREFLSGSWHIM
jgi:hypothetical protein